MSNKFSIIIPYLSNSECIELCKTLLKENTKNSFELIEIVDNNDVYAAFNDGVKRANEEIVILINDDMFVGKNWDVNYIKYTKNKNICTGYLVEPGVNNVSHKNIWKNFGKNPQKFKRQKFESWVEKQEKNTPEIINNEKGWYMPISFNKSTFVPYPNELKFPHHNDIILIDEILPKNGFSFCKVKSFIYHLHNQRWNKETYSRLKNKSFKNLFLYILHKMDLWIIYEKIISLYPSQNGFFDKLFKMQKIFFFIIKSIFFIVPENISKSELEMLKYFLDKRFKIVKQKLLLLFSFK